MTRLAGLIYQGDGATRPGIQARDYDLGEIGTLDPTVVEQAVASGVFRATFYEDEPTEVVVNDPTAGLTKAQLVALAAERGVEIDSGATKADLQAALA